MSSEIYFFSNAWFELISFSIFDWPCKEVNYLFIQCFYFLKRLMCHLLFIRYKQLAKKIFYKVESLHKKKKQTKNYLLKKITYKKITVTYC